MQKRRHAYSVNKPTATIIRCEHCHLSICIDGSFCPDIGKSPNQCRKYAPTIPGRVVAIKNNKIIVPNT